VLQELLLQGLRGNPVKDQREKQPCRHAGSKSRKIHFTRDKKWVEIQQMELEARKWAEEGQKYGPTFLLTLGCKDSDPNSIE
jgi:hypothetical protein